MGILQRALYGFGKGLEEKSEWDWKSQEKQADRDWQKAIMDAQNAHEQQTHDRDHTEHKEDTTAGWAHDAEVRTGEQAFQTGIHSADNAAALERAKVDAQAAASRQGASEAAAAGRLNTQIQADKETKVLDRQDKRVEDETSRARNGGYSSTTISAASAILKDEMSSDEDKAQARAILLQAARGSQPTSATPLITRDAANPEPQAPGFKLPNSVLSPSGIPAPKTPEEFARLPIGASFRDPDGNIRVKQR